VNEVIGILRLVEGDAAVKAVTAGIVASAVVYEKEELAAIGLLLESLIPVAAVTVYTVTLVCPLVVNTAWFALHEALVHPTTGLIVTVVVETVVQSTISDQLMVTLLFKATAVAPFAGTVELTAGAVLSMVTVLPAAGVSTLLDESVALLLIV
jgi:hypothetical protein